MPALGQSLGIPAAMLTSKCMLCIGNTGDYLDILGNDPPTSICSAQTSNMCWKNSLNRHIWL